MNVTDSRPRVVEGVPRQQPGVVQIRLIGDEADVNTAIGLLMAAGVGVAIQRPHRGRREQEWLAYGTLVLS